METNSGKVAQPKGIEYNHLAETPTYYVDGVTEVSIGMPVSKLTFHTTEGITGEGNEKRISRVQLALPTPALIEFCRNILARCLMNRDALEEAYMVSLSQTRHFLTGIDVTLVPPFEDSNNAAKK